MLNSLFCFSLKEYLLKTVTAVLLILALASAAMSD